MAYEVFTVPGFRGGLNLRSKPDAVAEDEAIDDLNVVFVEDALKPRSGYDKFTSSALTNPVDSLFPHYESDGTKQLLAGCGTRLEGLSSAGAVVASATGLTTGTWSFIRFGGVAAGATAEYSYAGNGKNNAQRWDGSAWTAVAAIGKPRYLAVQAVEDGNRMFTGGFDSGATGPAGATANPSRVHFSLAGAPEGVWGANDFNDFTPGDGEIIQGLISWREFIFVFKETKFFRITGMTEDEDGNPLLLWDTVDTGVGLTSPRAICADERGVWFLSRDGIYLTNGGEPVKMTDAVDPIFVGGSSDFYLGGELATASITNCAMGAYEDRIYFAFPTSSTNNRVLVYDPTYEWWSLWDMPASCLATFRDGVDYLVFGYPAGSNRVGKHRPGLIANDDGAAITWRWRGGFFDYGASEEKTIRESKIWGESSSTGAITFSVSADYATAVGTAQSIAFDTTNTVLPALARTSTRGTAFSTYFTDNTLNQTAAIYRFDHHLRELRVPSVVRT